MTIACAKALIAGDLKDRLGKSSTEIIRLLHMMDTQSIFDRAHKLAADNRANRRIAGRPRIVPRPR